MLSKSILSNTTNLLGKSTPKCVMLILIFSLFAACSDEKTYSTADGETTVKRRGNDIEISAHDNEGNKVTGQAGKNVAIPEDFPSDLPIYSGATPLVAMKMEGQGHSLTLESTDPLDKVHAFYVDAVQANGWAIDAQMDWGGQKMIAAKKGNQTAAISLSNTDGKTQIVLTVSKEE